MYLERLISNIFIGSRLRFSRTTSFQTFGSRSRRRGADARVVEAAGCRGGHEFCVREASLCDLCDLQTEGEPNGLQVEALAGLQR